ncbi:MAG: NAD(P)/FAD-dependent oxidoreductase [Vicinamibacterales bacterium]
MLPVLIIGAGPAGLGTAAELTRAGVAYRLLERGPTLAHSWANLYDSLVLHTGKHMSALPGLPFPRGTSLFPTRAEFLDYMRAYAAHFALLVDTNCDVRSLARVSPDEPDSIWQATLADGRILHARAVVVSTGIIANPRVPHIPGRDAFGGRVLHSVDYRRPDEFRGRDVLVVGVGNSGGEIGAELARAGARVTVAVRSGTHVVPREIAGVPLQYLAHGMRKLPKPVRRWLIRQVQQMTVRKRGAPVLPLPAHGPLDAIPLIGFHLVDAIKAGLVTVKRAGLDRFIHDGVVFADGTAAPFDVVILATGFSPALGFLGDLVRTDKKGFALRTDRVTSADQPGLYFVGHNYDTTGGLANIRIDANLVARALSRESWGSPRRSAGSDIGLR